MTNKKQNNYTEETKSSVVKITACIIAVIMTIATVFTVLAWGSQGFTNWDLPHWFGGWGSEISQPAPEPETVNEGYLLIDDDTEPAEGAGIRLMSMLSASDEKWVLVNAVFIPENTTEREVEWTLTMDGANVEEYIRTEVHPDGDSIKLTCIKPFTTPAVLTCTSKVKPELSATRNVHYLKEPFSIWNDSGRIVESTTTEFYIDEICYDEGTIAPDEMHGELTIEISPDLVEYLSDNGFVMNNTWTFYNMNSTDKLTIRSIFHRILNDWNSELETETQFWTVFGQWLKIEFGPYVGPYDSVYVMYVTAKFDYYYNAVYYGTFENGEDLEISSCEEFKVYPSGMDIGENGDIVFG